MTVSRIDQSRFRDTLSHYASGITIVSGVEEAGPVGFTCQSFYSVSMDPPLVSFSVMTNSTTYPRIREAGRFCVNVLSFDQDHLSNQFAKRGTDKWAGIEWAPSSAGNPIIAGSAMWLDCETFAEYEAGDHYIVVGHVNEMSPAEWHTRDPLLYFKGKYRHLSAAEDLREQAG